MTFGDHTLSETGLIPTESLRKLVDMLNALGIEFAIVGGVAVGLASTPRFTADIDAVLLDIDDRLEWLIEKLHSFGYKGRTSDPIGFARRTRVITLVDPGGTGIDLMMGLLPFDTELVHACHKVNGADGLIVPVASPEYLVVMKAVAWRTKDVEDIRQLVKMNPKMDRKKIVDTFAEFAIILETPERIGELEAMLRLD